MLLLVVNIMCIIYVECCCIEKNPGSCISRFLGSKINVNLAFVNIEVRFGGCFNAKLGLVSINFFLFSGSLMELNKFVLLLILCPYCKVG